MDQAPATQTILADNYLYEICTHISTAAQVSALQLCIHLVHIILQSSSSSLGHVANATYVPQPLRLIVLPYPPTPL